MAGINIAFASDVRSFLKGTGDVEGALEDVGDSLDDLTRDADRAGKDIGGDLEKVGQEGEDSAKHLERKFRDAFDDVKKDAKRSTDDVVDDTKRNMDRAGDASKEFKQEAGANFSEVASSFSGDMESAVDLVQGTLGGLANSIPGIGAVAGVAAAGIGTIYSVLSTQAENTRQNIEDITTAMIDANSKVLAESFIQQNLADIVSGADGAAISVANLRKASEETGVPVATLARAWAGDPGSVAEALATVRTGLAQAEQDVVSLDAAVAANSGIEGYRRWAAALEGLANNWDSAASGYELYQDAVAQGERANRSQVASTIEEYERRRAEIERTPTASTVRVTVEADTAAAARDIDELTKPRRVVIEGVTRYGQAVV